MRGQAARPESRPIQFDATALGWHPLQGDVSVRVAGADLDEVLASLSLAEVAGIRHDVGAHIVGVHEDSAPSQSLEERPQIVFWTAPGR